MKLFCRSHINKFTEKSYQRILNCPRTWFYILQHTDIMINCSAFIALRSKVWNYSPKLVQLSTDSTSDPTADSDTVQMRVNGTVNQCTRDCMLTKYFKTHP